MPGFNHPGPVRIELVARQYPFPAIFRHLRRAEKRYHSDKLRLVIQGHIQADILPWLNPQPAAGNQIRARRLIALRQQLRLDG